MLYTVQLFSSGADYVSIGLTREYWRRAEGTTPVGGSWADTHTVKAYTTLRIFNSLKDTTREWGRISRQGRDEQSEVSVHFRFAENEMPK